MHVASMCTLFRMHVAMHFVAPKALCLTVFDSLYSHREGPRYFLFASLKDFRISFRIRSLIDLASERIPINSVNNSIHD
jgi:hypothetical protein